MHKRYILGFIRNKNLVVWQKDHSLERCVHMDGPRMISRLAENDPGTILIVNS